MLVAQNIVWEISLIGLSLSLFTLANVLTKTQKHSIDRLFCFWIIILNIPLIHSVLAHTGVEYTFFRRITNPTFNLLHGPLLYFYVIMLIREKLTFNYNYLLHLVPFVLFYLLFFALSHPAPMLPGPAFLDDGNSQLAAGPVGAGYGLAAAFKPLIVHFGSVNLIVFLIYSILTIIQLMKHQKRVTGFFSQNDSQISLKWIYALPVSFVVISLLNVFNENGIGFSKPVYPLTLHLLSVLCFIIVLCFFGVKQQPVFKAEKSRFDPGDPLGVKEPAVIEGMPDAITKQPDVIVEEAVSEESSRVTNLALGDKTTSEVIEQMQTYMKTDKPYLESTFSVYNLAEALNIPRRTLSHVLNHDMSKNFYQYVNEYRVEEVKNRLRSEKDRESTILDIAFESGFKSKSSFNSLFKEYCHMTPSQYRKMGQI